MKILVTGGAGYIGSHVINLLGQEGHEIVVLDDLSCGRKKSVLYGTLVVGDIGNSELLDNLLAKNSFDAVMHFAGSIVVAESVKDPLKFYHNNSVNSLHLIRACLKYKIKNFIFSSTAAVYGEGEEICRESSPTLPINPYGKSKLFTEWVLQDLSLSHNFRYVSLRYFNVAGAHPSGKIGQYSPISTHLIKIACEAAVGKRQSMQIFGNDYPTPDGTCLRDYIHVDDLASAHLLALKYLHQKGKSMIFNCGYNRGHSVREVIDTVKRVSGKDFPVELAPRRMGDPAKLLAHNQLIKEVLGWKPQFDQLDYIVKTAYQWEKNLFEEN